MNADELDAWRERQRAKGAQARRFAGLERAAFVASLEPTTPAKPGRKPRPRPARTGPPKRHGRQWPHGRPTDAELVEQYDAGASLSQLAARHGVALETIRRNLKAAGAQLRPASTAGGTTGAPRDAAGRYTTGDEHR